jgi:hypothetical protein
MSKAVRAQVRRAAHIATDKAEGGGGPIPEWPSPE